MRFLRPEQTFSLHAPLAPQAGVVHVWPFELIDAPQALQASWALLSAEEDARARRFVFDRHRTAFVFAHGQLRHVLSLYSGVPGPSLQFVSGAAGKPELAPAQSFARSISFNLTHSETRALLAVGDGRALGVDLECHRPQTDALAIASRYFFGSEFEAVRNAPPALLAPTFYRFWTAKEAVLKAQGIGLGAPLNAFRVPLAQYGEPAPVQTLDRSRIDEGWVVMALACEPGWSAAVAAKSTDWSVEVMGQSFVGERYGAGDSR